MARPKKELDRDEFEKLCAMQCTEEEICGWFDVTDKTLVRWIKETYDGVLSFSEIYTKKRSLGKISLRRNMWKMSEKNPTMALWLSKQHLGMTDKNEVEMNTKIEVNLDSEDMDV